MLLDVRIDTCRPGTIKKHLALYERRGTGPQTRHLGEPVAYHGTETGNVNSFLHIWAYRDAQDRAERRARMQADPRWVDYQKRSAEAGYLLSQDTQLMTEAPFLKP